MWLQQTYCLVSVTQTGCTCSSTAICACSQFGFILLYGLLYGGRTLLVTATAQYDFKSSSALLLPCVYAQHVYVMAAGKCDLDASDHCHFPGYGSQPEATGVCTEPRGAAAGVEQQLVGQVLQARQLVAGEDGCAVPCAHLPQSLCPLVSAAAAVCGCFELGKQALALKTPCYLETFLLCTDGQLSNTHAVQQQSDSGTMGCLFGLVDTLHHVCLCCLLLLIQLRLAGPFLSGQTTSYGARVMLTKGLVLCLAAPLYTSETS